MHGIINKYMPFMDRHEFLYGKKKSKDTSKTISKVPTIHMKSFFMSAGSKHRVQLYYVHINVSYINKIKICINACNHEQHMPLMVKKILADINFSKKCQHMLNNQNWITDKYMQMMHLIFGNDKKVNSTTDTHNMRIVW